MNDKIKPKQQRFIDEYLVSLNATQAAIKAGYSPKSADVHACRMLGNDRIKALIDERLALHSKNTGETKERILLSLREIADRCMAKEPILDKDGNNSGIYKFNASGAIRALELLGKHLGMFSEKMEIKQNITHEEALLELDRLGSNSGELVKDP